MYVVRPAGCGKKFICELFLPTGSGLPNFEGPAMNSKAAARRAAAFGACLQLRKDSFLNENLLPVYQQKQIPEYANARLAVDINKVNSYSYQRKPTFWNVKDDTPPTQLWLTIIELTRRSEMFLGREQGIICIATREKLPRMPSFSLFGTGGGESEVRLVRLEKPVLLTQEQLKLFDVFTDRAFMDVFNKHFEITYSTLRYWLAPLNGDQFSADSIGADIVDWSMLNHVASARNMDWEPGQSPHVLTKKFLVDRTDRSRRFIVYGYAEGYKPTDLVPGEISKAGEFENIRDYSYNAGKRRKWAQVKWVIPDDEPVFRAERLLHRLNFLDRPSERDVEAIYDALICSSNFNVSMIPAALVRAILLLPSVSTRIDGYLHAWDLTKKLGLDGLDLGLALEAITKDSDNTNQPLEKQSNKQRGMGRNYERLEFLGDCYLKLVSFCCFLCRSLTPI